MKRAQNNFCLGSISCLSLKSRTAKTGGVIRRMRISTISYELKAPIIIKLWGEFSHFGAA